MKEDRWKQTKKYLEGTRINWRAKRIFIEISSLMDHIIGDTSYWDEIIGIKGLIEVGSAQIGDFGETTQILIPNLIVFCRFG